MPEHDFYVYAVLALCAVMTGMAKSGVPALGTCMAAILAAVYPTPKDTVGILLLILIAGDIFAVAYYSRHARISVLIRIFPYVLVGMAIGAFTLHAIKDEHFRPALALIIGSMLLIDFWSNRSAKLQDGKEHGILRSVTGIGAGVASTVGNAAGPIMSIYLLLMKLPKKEFLGTAAWFFFILNLSKIPIYLHMDIIRADTARLSAIAIPFVGIGSFLGVKFVKHCSQDVFRKAILWTTAASVVWLLLA